MGRPLDEYARKRKIARTPEPPPREFEGDPGSIFCIQRHEARRLHYDLRLAIDGTLKSWALPQGPSLDPSRKPLAVAVEDHPIEYASFEGNIPAGNYGAGSMMLWDRGTFETLGDCPAVEQIARGDFKFRLAGEKLRGEFALVRMKDRVTGQDSRDWLLIKKKDGEERPGWDAERLDWSVKTGRRQVDIALDVPPLPLVPMPAAIGPMLATLAAEPPTGPEWLFEIKWDGIRAMAHAADGQTRLTGRKGNDITRQYPELAAIHERLRAASAIVDGEITVLDAAGRPSFARIQPRIMAASDATIRQHQRTRPAVFFAFDLLSCDGRDLRGLPLRERRRRLEAMLDPGPQLRLSESFLEGQDLLAVARAQGLEGIVAKRAASPYESVRSADWVKVKAVREQEFLLCGFTKGERDYFGALLLGVWDQGRLHFAGSVGTGFDRRTMQALAAQLTPLIVPESPFPERVSLPQPVTWTRPELVATVRYLEWTADGRLRAPVFAGLRTDIDPAACVRETRAPVAPSWIPAGSAEVTVPLAGRPVRIKNLDKLYYPADGVTKRDVLNFYERVADYLIPHWRDRPLSLRRYPDGIEGEGFFQKNAEGLPDWIRTATIDDGGPMCRVIGDGRDQLLYLAQLGCIDQNPWMSRLDSLDHPDFMLIDLDPQQCPFDRIVEAAQLIRQKLEALGLRGFPKTTGGDGMHIYVPVRPVYRYDQTKALAEILARVCAAERPDLFTLPRSVAQRRADRVYFDYLQNGRGKTISAPYVLRAHPGAPVATPLDWTEVRPGLNPKQFHIRNAPDRFRRAGDLFRGVLELPQELETALEKLPALLVR